MVKARCVNERGSTTQGTECPMSHNSSCTTKTPVSACQAEKNSVPQLRDRRQSRPGSSDRSLRGRNSRCRTPLPFRLTPPPSRLQGGAVLEIRGPDIIRPMYDERRHSYLGQNRSRIALGRHSMIRKRRTRTRREPQPFGPPALGVGIICEARGRCNQRRGSEFFSGPTPPRSR